jgi:hypothetical protein
VDICGGLVFFENTVCLRCSTPPRFDPERLLLVAMEAGAPWADCANRGLAGCNWLAGAPGALCASCVLTRTRPSNADAMGLEAFAVAERAKRRVGVVVEGPRAVAADDSLSAIPPVDPGQDEFATILESWLPLTYALNAINRSMGRDDLYPFTLAPEVVEKLSFAHRRVLDGRQAR